MRVYPTTLPFLGDVEVALKPDLILGTILASLIEYLTNIGDSEQYAQFVDYVEYAYELFPLIDKEAYSLDWIGEFHIKERKHICISQRILRDFFSMLYRYTKISRYKNYVDIELRDEMRSRIEAMNLGPEFDAMIDMIHRYKGDVLYISDGDVIDA